MRRSKMEIHLDVLKTLAQKGPLKLTHIMYKANINCSVLKEYIDFLMIQGLVEETTLRKQKIAYKITEKGLTVLKHFEKLQTILPVNEEEVKIPFAVSQNKTYFISSK